MVRSEIYAAISLPLTVSIDAISQQKKKKTKNEDYLVRIDKSEHGSNLQ
jgi:transcriptional regulatory protein LevR